CGRDGRFRFGFVRSGWAIFPPNEARFCGRSLTHTLCYACDLRGAPEASAKEPIPVETGLLSVRIEELSDLFQACRPAGRIGHAQSPQEARGLLGAARGRLRG